MTETTPTLSLADYIKQYGYDLDYGNLILNSIRDDFRQNLIAYFSYQEELRKFKRDQSFNSKNPFTSPEPEKKRLLQPWMMAVVMQAAKDVMKIHPVTNDSTFVHNGDKRICRTVNVMELKKRSHFDRKEIADNVSKIVKNSEEKMNKKLFINKLTLTSLSEFDGHLTIYKGFCLNVIMG